MSTALLEKPSLMDLSLVQLKLKAKSLGIVFVSGNPRHKKNWVEAIEAYEPTEPTEPEEVEIPCDGDKLQGLLEKTALLNIVLEKYYGPEFSFVRKNNDVIFSTLESLGKLTLRESDGKYCLYNLQDFSNFAKAPEDMIAKALKRCGIKDMSRPENWKKGDRVYFSGSFPRCKPVQRYEGKIVRINRDRFKTDITFNIYCGDEEYLFTNVSADDITLYPPTEPVPAPIPEVEIPFDGEADEETVLDEEIELVYSVIPERPISIENIENLTGLPVGIISLNLMKLQIDGRVIPDHDGYKRALICPKIGNFVRFRGRKDFGDNFADYHGRITGTSTDLSGRIFYDIYVESEDHTFTAPQIHISAILDCPPPPPPIIRPTPIPEQIDIPGIEIAKEEKCRDIGSDRRECNYEKPCTTCDGSGLLDKNLTCINCNGKGWRSREEQLTINIRNICRQFVCDLHDSVFPWNGNMQCTQWKEIMSEVAAAKWQTSAGLDIWQMCQRVRGLYKYCDDRKPNWGKLSPNVPDLIQKINENHWLLLLIYPPDKKFTKEDYPYFAGDLAMSEVYFPPKVYDKWGVLGNTHLFIMPNEITESIMVDADADYLILRGAGE